MSSEEMLREIATEVSTCTKCKLCKGRTRAVPGEGNPNAKILFIGEGPGYHEDQQGRPFVGPAGQFLDELLASINLKRSDVFIANVVKCRPPQNRDPEAELQPSRSWNVRACQQPRQTDRDDDTDHHTCQ